MPADQDTERYDRLGLIVASLTGLFCAIALVKFGNPVILENFVTRPENLLEWIIQPWPIALGYIFLIPVALAGVFAAVSQAKHSPQENGNAVPKRLQWIIFLPLAWIGWQFLAATQTVDSRLTAVTLQHFAACVGCFYIGYFGLRYVKNPWPIWLGLTVALVWIIRVGFEQHFGGLEETRRYFYQLPNWQQAHPDFLKKIQSDRIFSTLFYPNTLAGVILLVLPISITFIWQSTSRFPKAFRLLVVSLLGMGAVACLFWSGSKAGWLLFLILMMIVLWHSTVPWRKWLIYGLLAAGLAGFGFKYAGFFKRGSTSVVARFDYWKAAWQTSLRHPVFGTGPGSFSVPYASLKSPASEMAKLTHNDYLEQASDSGFLGFLTYSAFIAGSLRVLYRYRRDFYGDNPMFFAVWLGLLGVALHCLVEFHLYIPAIAWVFFLLLGWLWAWSGRFVAASRESGAVIK